jgi:FkbM family methyltransferase
MQIQTSGEGQPQPALLRYFHYLKQGTLIARIRARLDANRRARRRAWWQAEYEKGRQFKDIRLLPGIRFRLFWNSEISWLLYVKDFEATERRFHQAFLRKGDVYLDIGANIGLFTVIAARKVGSTGRVYAFEPIAATYDRLQQNIALNRYRNVSSYKVALSDAAGQAEMTISTDGFDGRNSMAKPTGGEQFALETVSLSTLDAFVAEHDLAGRITMVKIDVEGWENHVLAGASRTFSAPDAPLLHVEFTEEALQTARCSSAELYQALKKFGYELFLFDEENHGLKPVSQEEVRDRFVNVIATKQPDRVLARLKG